ncbi:MAG: hypothetical protein H0X13_16370 [Ramlibacter sp.]|nr:hypothetical protein [Ramlibacter sp.]
MAFKIVAESTSASDALPGVTKSSRLATEHFKDLGGKRGRYYAYTPGIALVPGVHQRKSNDDRYDLYSGAAEALEAAGLLRAELLPPDGHNMITWRPGGGRLEGEGWHEVPGYLTIYRTPGVGLFRVKIAVSREEQARREAELKRRHCEHLERVRERENEDNARPTAAPEREITAAEQLGGSLGLCEEIALGIANGDLLTEADKRHFLDLMSEAINLLSAAKTIAMNRRPAPTRGGLKLVWSTPAPQ